MEYNYNECPECHSISTLDTCLVCGTNLAEYRKKLHDLQMEEMERVEKEKRYTAALEAFVSNDYPKAVAAFLTLQNYKDSESYAQKAELALFESTLVKEFFENPFINMLYTDDLERRSQVSDDNLRTLLFSGKSIYKICEKFEKYREKEYIPTKKYIIACDYALAEVARITEYDVLMKQQEAELNALRKKYKKGKKAFSQEEFKSAIKIFEELGAFENAPQMLEKSKVLYLERAKKYLMSGYKYRTIDAIEIFKNLKLEDFPPEELEKINELCLKTSQTYISNADYESAVILLKWLGNYKNASELLLIAEKAAHEQNEINRIKARKKERKEKIIGILILTPIIIIIVISIIGWISPIFICIYDLICEIIVSILTLFR